MRLYVAEMCEDHTEASSTIVQAAFDLAEACIKPTEDKFLPLPTLYYTDDALASDVCLDSFIVADTGDIVMHHNGKPYAGVAFQFNVDTMHSS